MSRARKLVMAMDKRRLEDRVAELEYLLTRVMIVGNKGHLPTPLLQDISKALRTNEGVQGTVVNEG